MLVALFLRRADWHLFFRAGERKHRRLICIFCFLGFLSNAFALRFDVFAGYGDVVPEADWFPIVCELRNDGPSFNGNIEVTSGLFGSGQVRQFPIELPTGTTKRVVVPVFSTSRDGSWTCRLKDDRGKTRAETEFTPRQQKIRQPRMGTTIMAALSRTLTGLPTLPQIKSSQTDLQPVVGRMQPVLFPDNPLALSGLHILYLSSLMALELTAPQVEALHIWLQKGGHLVVAVEQASDLQGAPWLRSLIPCDFTGLAVKKPGNELQQWTAAYFSAPPTTGGKRFRGGNASAFPLELSREISADADFDSADLPMITGRLLDGKVLAGSGTEPLLIEARRGRGRLTVLTFSPEREPFLSWKNRAWFWARLAEIPPELYQSSDLDRRMGMSSDGIFGTMVDSKQVRKLPLGWLLLLLVVYLIVIGPLDHYWLKKMNRQMLTWITFPCYVVFFSVLIYYIGFRLRAGDSEFNELQLVDVIPAGNETLFSGRTYASIYSPSNQKYPLQSEQPFATLRGEYFANFGRSEESSSGLILQHGNHFDAEVLVPVWTSQLFVSDWTQEGSVPVKLSFERHRSEWKISMENQLAHPLLDVRVCLDGRVYEIGEVAANQTRVVNLNTGIGLPLKDFVQGMGSRFVAAVQRRRNTFGDNPEGLFPSLSAASMGASFLGLMRNGDDVYRNFIPDNTLDLTRFADSGHAILLALVRNYGVAPPLNRFSPRRSERNTVLRLVIPIP